MNKVYREILMNKSKKELIDIIDNFQKSSSVISEFCVSNSKQEISDTEAIEQIRKNIYYLDVL